MRHLSRLLCCVTVVATAFLVPMNSAFGQSESLSTTKCLNNSSDCPAVIGQLHSHSSQREVSRFLRSLIEADLTEAPLLGVYGIHGCSNPGSPSYKVTCYLWPSAPKKDLVKLEGAFRASKLFRNVKLRNPLSPLP
jgi:hypothetical protein